ncbi:hypothetical protein LOC08_08480 [Lactobacillus delbrueckii subsp. lactis]|uniref:hypothetical protein n=1 Tax=Lactobacillus delbrueckii TaxID=1584 RepID=UPI001E2A8A9D|nr:hypothetical protein [Lactobacillus delbrueckii]MCD5507246.1 hypothetical protein [Lactobacillus delbrueckii subsp. lactis]MCD5520480.1 hypothetical protein [Lactobacillus delbrueckii subsp. lactis]MCD5524332.1 hypothetical protein [Lactobacillus delbrueckii subsp. lactis]MCD5526228.1 hypothetical protein [Lactobacillus delbrueckii subsp. lactis]
MTAFTGVDSQNLPDVMVSVQFILAIGDQKKFIKKIKKDMKDSIFEFTQRVFQMQQEI